ncbi:MAG: tagaturonate epimerase family protein [Verrucomicrobia bacterium]|nr:tagaturonate epimerase family protein [Verrucomicrobiota bacterium]MCG2679467.1 tagaturonate epimerase family protein [Kiritimatiellia bacterium]MBU4247535.1 tagaturonate epimerase family protein [Verrucomicrobiota bacterium]MBU4289664.1 tagaturonate epimerase family protein [Verrucomicrobiota bacterium]MBU4429256.1 tagaturonate epimerase family protein [Verrucomicrobiota bacterium]
MTLSKVLSPSALRSKYPATRPAVLNQGPVFGFGYRSPWILGNIVQAKVARQYRLNVMLAQQSAREIERTKRSFQEVVDSATLSAHAARLALPWGADGDHLKSDADIRAAVKAGCTHFTYDVSPELAQGLQAVVEKISAMYRLTRQLKGREPFTIEISLDETEHATTMEDVIRLLQALKKKGITVTEIAPRFPGYFEKAIDYYLRMEQGRRVHDTTEFERYLTALAEVVRGFGVRICVHSGSDKFSIYPIMAKVLKNDFHLKTAGTYYLEELKIVARHDVALFRAIYRFSLAQFQKDRVTYELSADLSQLPDVETLAGQALSSLLHSGGGNDHLRQVLHVTYGSVLTARDGDGYLLFADAMAKVLKQNEADYMQELEQHLLRHIRPFISA